MAPVNRALERQREQRRFRRKTRRATRYGQSLKRACQKLVNKLCKFVGAVLAAQRQNAETEGMLENADGVLEHLWLVQRKFGQIFLELYEVAQLSHE